MSLLGVKMLPVVLICVVVSLMPQDLTCLMLSVTQVSKLQVV